MTTPSPTPPRQWHGFELFPFQAEAIDAVEAGHSLLVSAPTGAGKTMVAEYVIERSLARGERVIYTSPVKALSNQKFRDFTAAWGDRVGIMTGDVTLNPGASALIMTTEIFRNTLFLEPSQRLAADWLVMDEIHYIADSDRGTVWEECLMFAPPNVRFVGLSASISNLEEFRAWMQAVRGSEVRLIETRDRPVPLKHHVWTPETGPLKPGELKRALAESRHAGHGRGRKRGPRPPELVDWVANEGKLPGLFFCFSRRECELRARRAARRGLVARDKSRKLAEMFDALAQQFGVENDSATPDMRALAVAGTLYHHAGMLPVWKEITERLFTTGLLGMLFTTETFALGVNMPARSVSFSSLRKFNGTSFDWLTPLYYHQMAGRAGRKGLDEEGLVFANVDPEKDDASAVKDVIFGKVPPLISRFNLPYNAVLRLWQDLGEGIYDAVGRSFAAWQKKDGGKAARIALRGRLKVLERQRYIQGKGLSAKGRLAARLQGFEIPLTELHAAGCFEELSAAECAQLLLSVVHEARRADVAQRFQSAGLHTAGNRARKRCMEFLKAEREAGLTDTIRLLDTSLGAAMAAWTQGARFEELRQFTSAQDGDIVRSFRMTVQVLRDLALALHEDQGLVERLQKALTLVNRDEVDAEALLLISAGRAPARTKARPHLGKARVSR
jgi:superfamily II RNA helicase